MEPLFDNFIKATGWSILHSLWQGALVYGLLLTLLTGIPKLRSGTKHNLAFLAQCLLFAGFCATFHSLFSPSENSGELTASSINIARYTTVYLSELPSGWNAVAESMFPYLVGLYGAGLVLQLIILFLGYQRVQKMKHAGRNIIPEDWAAIFAEVKSALKIRRDVGFYLSAKVSVPLVIGYFKPVVLFPVALATQMDLKQVEAILIHELSHIRRNDYLLNLIKTAIQTALFFNPFVWLCGKFIDQERENACDDMVLKHTGTPLTYAHALLKLELLKSTNHSALSMAAIGKTQHLYQRIKRITDMKTNYMNAKQRLLAMTLILGTFISLAWANPQKPGLAVNAVKKQLSEVAENPIFNTAGVLSGNAAQKNAVQPVQDTLKKKAKIKIVTTDEKGNTREYNSLKEMPDSLRKEVMVRVISIPKGPGKSIDSVIAFHRQMTPGRLHQDTNLFNKHIEQARKQAVEIRRYYSSPEWKKHMEEMTKDSKAAGKIAADLLARVTSAGFESQLHDIMIKGQKIKEKFNSEEWRKQMEELKKFQNSKEYKDLQEKQKKELERLKKKKGIKSDLVSLPSMSIAPFTYILPPPVPAEPSVTSITAPPAPPTLPEANLPAPPIRPAKP